MNFTHMVREKPVPYLFGPCFIDDFTIVLAERYDVVGAQVVDFTGVFVLAGSEGKFRA